MYWKILINLSEGGKEVSADKVKARLKLLGLLPGEKRSMKLKRFRDKHIQKYKKRNKKFAIIFYEQVCWD